LKTKCLFVAEDKARHT